MPPDRILAFPGQGVPAEDLLAAVERHRGHPLVQDALRLAGGNGLASLDVRDTRVVQPLVYALSFAAARQLLSSSVRLVMGHSLGELTAYAVAGVVDPADALQIAAARGALCHRHPRAREGRMMAVMGLDQLTIEWARRVAVARSDAILDVAAYNGRRQLVLTGDPAGFEALVPIVADLAGIVAELPIGGSFHSPLMQPATAEFDALLRSFELRAPAIPVLSTIDCVQHTDRDALRDQLVRGLVLPVRWTDAVVAAASTGVTDAVDVGPGQTLQKLGRRDRTTGLRWTGADAAVTA